ncbi:RDD family protein [Oceaniglobus roseus]|uniref:RDD family protein n=1 Tax=Oceaniglobus roseus TaxID=1737570 RepID=UPI000C7F028C|nr:RDD family protein [Kandeliimicrobium roseum]
MTFHDPALGLPDPDRDADFYADVATKRFFAWLIDVLLIGLISVLTLPFTLFLGLFFFPLIWITVGFLYRTASLANRSATPGMRVMSIEFRTARGETFDLTAALLHTIGYTASMTVFPLQLVSVVLMLTTSRGQGLTDHLLGTAAINRAAAS